MASLETQLQNEENSTVDLLQKLKKDLSVLDPENGKVKDKVFLNKVAADPLKDLENLEKAFTTALEKNDPNARMNALKDVKNKATNLMLKLTQVIENDYKKYQSKLETRTTTIATLSTQIESLLGKTLPEALNSLNPAENHDQTTKKFWDTISYNENELKSLETKYLKSLESTDPDKQIKELTDIKDSVTKLATVLEGIISSQELLNDVMQVEEEKFLSEIDKKLQTPLSEYDQKILKELPGKNDEEKKWNYNLLNAYSDAFATQNVPAGKTAWLTTSEKKSTTVSLMGSLQIAEWWNGKNGKDVIDQQKISRQKWNPLDVWIKRADKSSDLAQAVANPNPGVKHIEDVAQYANNINTVTPIYFSLVREHYLTLLVQKDRYYNNSQWKNTLPDHQKENYDEIAKTSPSRWPVQFTWEWLDSDGLDWSFKDDTYTFQNIDDKKSFLEWSMKLLPYLDTLWKKFQEKEFLWFFDKAWNVVGSVLDIMEWIDKHIPFLHSYRFIEGMLKVLTAVGNPAGLALWSALSLWSRWEWQTNLPYNIFIIKALLYALRSITQLPWIRSIKVWVGLFGPKFKEIEKDFAEDGKYPHKSISDIIWYKRASVQEKIVSDIALAKLKYYPENGAPSKSFQEYQVSRDIILHRQQGPVTLPVKTVGGIVTETVTLWQITPEFANALLLMHNIIIEDECLRQYQNIKRGKDADATLNFEKVDGSAFNITDITCKKLIENATVYSNPFMQVLTWNTTDTSRLIERGPWRILRGASPDIKQDFSTKWNAPKVYADLTIWKLTRAVTSRFPGLWWRRIDPSLIYYESFSIPTLFQGKPNEGLARRFLDDLVAARKIDHSLLPESLTEEDVRTEVKELLKNGQIFNDDAERALLEDFAKSVRGVVRRSTWEYTVARLWFVCRWDGAPTPAEIIGLDSLDGMNAHIDANQLSTQESRNKVESAYKKIKNSELLTPKEIMELGKLTGSRFDLTGATDANSHIIWNGRTEMDELENEYYIADLVELHDDANFTTKYEEWFFKNAKSCSAQYDFEKHSKLLMAQKKLQEYMKKGGELETALKDGSEHDREEAIKRKMRSLSINPDAPWFTQIFKGDYDTRIIALETVRGGTESKAITEVETEIRKLHQEMKDWTLWNIDDYKTQLAQKLRWCKPSKVALDFINLALGGTARVDLEPAIKEYCDNAEVKFEARIADIIRLMNDTSIWWEERYAALADYRQYGESSEERWDDRGRKIVSSAYDAIHNEIKSGSPAEQYSKYESYCAAINPEEWVSDLRKKNSKEATFRKTREKAIDDYRTHAQEAVDGIFDTKRYPTFEQLESNMPTDIKNIKSEYWELSAKMIKSAEARFKAIEAGHQAVRILCDSVARGSKTRKDVIDKELGTITTMHPEYVKLYLAQASRAVDDARDQYTRSLSGKTDPAEPKNSTETPWETPPKAVPQKTPESTPTAPPNNPSTRETKPIDMEAIINDPVKSTKSKFDQAYKTCDPDKKTEFLNRYVDRLKQIVQNPSLPIEDRVAAISILKDPIVQKKIPTPEARTEINAFLEVSEKSLERERIENEARAIRQENAEKFAEHLRKALSWLTPELRQAAMIELIANPPSDMTGTQLKILEHYFSPSAENWNFTEAEKITHYIQESMLHIMKQSEWNKAFEDAGKAFQETLKGSVDMVTNLKRMGIEHPEKIMDDVKPLVRERMEAKARPIWK